MKKPPRISLCIIAGNEAGIITRMLDSFAPAFDELSLVLALGNQKPDRTFNVASDWCVANGKAFVPGRYQNAPENDWPHVDDFAAARNKAFEHASGDWLLWADCDDIASADIGDIRAIAASADRAAVHLFPYVVLGTAKNPDRERMISRELFRSGLRWRRAIHEIILPRAGDALCYHAAPTWNHSPPSTQTLNRDRNLRILSGQLRDAPTNFFYWHQELFNRGNPADAARAGELVMQLPNCEPSFRYQAALNLCRLESDANKAVARAMDAHEIYPWCREAMAELVTAYMELGARSHVAHWLARFENTPPPDGTLRPWTHEPKWYGWAGDDLCERAYRWLGNRSIADSLAAARDCRVTLIHSTGNPAKAVSLRSAWLEFAADPARVRYIFKPADDATRRALAQFDSPQPASGPTREITDADTPTPGWDSAL